MTAAVAARFAPSPATARPATKPGLLARAFRALHDAQMRSAERRIARYIQCHGARLTDRIERGIGDGRPDGWL